MTTERKWKPWREMTAEEKQEWEQAKVDATNAAKAEIDSITHDEWARFGKALVGGALGAGFDISFSETPPADWTISSTGCGCCSTTLHGGLKTFREVIAALESPPNGIDW